MGKASRTWLPAVAAASVLTLVFSLLAYLLYLRTEARVVEKHSQDQQLLARSAAIALAQRVDNYRHIVEPVALRLASLPEQQWDGVLNELVVASPGSDALVLRPDGTFHLQQARPDASALEAVLLPWAGTRETVLTNPFPATGPDRRVVLLIPVVSKVRLIAQVGFVFPFDDLLEPLFPRTVLHEMSISLLDDQGVVLTNTRHPEMTGRRIPPPGQSCLPCHSSFVLERRMLAGQAGVDRLQVAGQPLALVAFAPVELPRRRWSLALSEPRSAITADTRRGFRGITLLLGLSLLLGVVAVTVTLQHRAKRRRAEERAKLAERRADLERTLRQSEQLAALGKMTSQIAHQINTPLAALGLNVAYLREELARRLGDANADVREAGDAILGEIDRLKHVVNDYLRFSRFPEPVLTVESLREVLHGFLDFVEHEARERSVRLEADLGAEPATTRIDTDLFRDAFLNLVRNSFEAMPGGGTLRVRLRREGPELVLSLHDTGRGIPADVLPRIFDPFFTTKKGGTGLGLAHTRRVLEEQGGRIDCASAPGQGTTFVVRLPAIPAEEAPAEELLATEKGR